MNASSSSSEWARGDRVALVSITDPHTRLRPGDTGTVASVDGLGTVHVRWDDGHSLGMVPGEDVIEPAGPGDYNETEAQFWGRQPGPPPAGYRY